MPTQPTIFYTKTDEAPLLATYSLLPILQSFAKHADIAFELRDISLAGRILAVFADRLPENQKTSDALAELGALTLQPDANIIKLPNISASIPQLKAAIAELQARGFALPDYPETPATDSEKDTKARYDKVKGSAVNPVLREGNSDRRAPKAVKDYARKHPHKMAPWSKDSKTRVATMGRDDFRSNEKSTTLPAATTARIEFTPTGGVPVVWKSDLKLQAGEVLDATYMSRKALQSFLAEQIDAAQREGVLFSLHLKATMMKVSDPVLFGHAVKTFLGDFTTRHAAAIEKLGVDFNNGLGDLLAKIEKLPAAEKAAIESDLQATLAARPPLAMVNSDK
ncbi:MAG: NADP-dependent isocitrate dehydrogenase, partial [Verrucomicrobiota bacterium]